MKVQKPSREYIFFFQENGVFTTEHTTDLGFRSGHSRCKDGDYLFTRPIPPNDGEIVIFHLNDGWGRVPLYSLPKVLKAYFLAIGIDIP